MEIRQRRPYQTVVDSSASQNASNSEHPIDALTHISGVSLWQWSIVCVIFLLCVVLAPIQIWSCSSGLIFAENKPNTTFQEHFAREHLQFITNLGPRTCGSINNEIHAKKYLLSKLVEFALLANASGLLAEVDDHVSTSSSFQTHAHTTSYSNVHNLVLRLHDPRVQRHSLPRAVLVNCHYDSVPNSPGASDDFVSCANALEVIRILSNGKHSLVNNVIFLFNSAEETILTASHAFITQHKWAKEISTFVNLEGAGAGGKLLMFQSGPGPSSSVLIEMFAASACKPSGTVFGEEIFQLGLIPSDTDFRIFRDYGMIPGLDMAYVENGYAYHTPNDIEMRISAQCLELAGENLLKLVKIMATDSRVQTMKQLKPINTIFPKPKPKTSPVGGSANIHKDSASSKISEPSRLVYFDVMGNFLFKYPWSIGRILHASICTFIMLWIFMSNNGRLSFLSGIVLATSIQLLFLLTGFLFMAALGYATHIFGCRMTWYTNRYNMFGIYFLPIVTYFVHFHTFFLNLTNSIIYCHFPFKHLLDKSEWIKKVDNRIILKAIFIENDFFKSTMLLLNSISLFCVVMDSPSSYFTILWCSMTLFLRSIYMKFSTTHKSCSLCKKLITLIPPLIFIHLSPIFLLFEVFIPIYGRSGHMIKPDVGIAILIFIVSFPFFLFFADFLHVTSSSSSRQMRRILLNACLTFAVLIHTTTIGFPYAVRPSENAYLDRPSHQRTVVFHTNRAFRENPLSSAVTTSDSGIFLTTADVNKLRYYHHPQSSGLHSLISKLWSYTSNGQYDTSALPDLDNIGTFTCQRQMPYCGVPLLYPLLHAFDTFYYLPTPKHNSPSSKLEIINRQIQPNSDHHDGIDHFVNLTFSVNSRAAQTHFYVHTKPQFVYLYNWSFAPEAGPPEPISVPIYSSSERDLSLSNSAHFFVSHIDPSTTTSFDGFFDKPWIFWLQLAVRTGPKFEDNLSECTTCIDVALGSQYLDTAVTYGNSKELTNLLNSLPSWSVPMSWVSSYDHWRLPLNKMHD